MKNFQYLDCNCHPLHKMGNTDLLYTIFILLYFIIILINVDFILKITNFSLANHFH
jgi:hypothetical protein